MLVCIPLLWNARQLQPDVVFRDYIIESALEPRSCTRADPTGLAAHHHSQLTGGLLSRQDDDMIQATGQSNVVKLP